MADSKPIGSTAKLFRMLQTSQNMLKKFQTCKEEQLQAGKAEDSPEILLINLKISEFEKDIGILKQKLSVSKNDPVPYSKAI